MVSDLFMPILFAGLLWKEIEYSCWQYQSWTDENIHIGESKQTHLNIEKNKLYAFYPKMFSSYDAAYSNRWS